MKQGKEQFLDDKQIGVIVGMLSRQPHTAAELMDKSGLESTAVYLSLNWLLKENKIRYSNQSPVKYRLVRQ
jgi:sugar-specific transcriptional regulator TrmB